MKKILDKIMIRLGYVPKEEQVPTYTPESISFSQRTVDIIPVTRIMDVPKEHFETMKDQYRHRLITDLVDHLNRDTLIDWDDGGRSFNGDVVLQAKLRVIKPGWLHN